MKKLFVLCLVLILIFQIPIIKSDVSFTKSKNIGMTYNPSDFYYESGLWNPINLYFKDVSIDGYQYLCDETWYDFYVKSHSNWGDGVKFVSNSNYSFIYQLQDYSYRDEYGSQDYISSISDVVGEVTTDEIRYNDVFSDVDLLYTLKSMRVKEDFIIHSLPKIPAEHLGNNISLDFGAYVKFDDNIYPYVNNVNMSGTDFITSNSIDFLHEAPVEIEEGIIVSDVLFSLPAPFAVDSDGNRVTCYYEVEFRENEIWFYTRVPYDFLESAVFPVFVDPSFTEESIYTNIKAPRGFSNGDIDDDGDIDFSVCDWDNYELSWWENDGTGSFTKHIIDNNSLGNIASVRKSLIVDLDEDGVIDIVLATSQGPPPSDAPVINWYENDGTESFTAHMITNTSNTLSGRSYDIYHGDIDLDNDIDLIVNDRSNDCILWLNNSGSESFTPINISKGVAIDSTSVRGLELVDLDGDGDLDVVFNDQSSSDLEWLENVGTETFTHHNQSFGFDSQYWSSSGDFNGDNDMDLVIVDFTTNNAIATIAWYENDGSELFTQHVLNYTLDQGSIVRTIDFDDDGDMDIYAGFYGGGAYYWENDGTGSFTQYVLDESMIVLTGMDCFDADDDGDNDFLLGNSSGDKLHILFQNSSPVFSNEYPSNSSSISTITPTCNVTISDIDDSSFNVTFLENSSGSFQVVETYNSVGDGSYSFTFSNADSSGTYWWRVYADDGVTNISETYSFTLSDFLWIDITNNSWNLGNVQMGSSTYTNETGYTFIADMDNTTVNTDLKLQITGDATDWSAASSGNSPGVDTYRLNASVDTWVSENQIVTASATTISSNIASGNNETFDLRFDAPTTSSTGSSQTITTTASLVKT